MNRSRILKTTFIAVLLFLGTGLTYSQNTLKLGVEAGLNLANANTTPSVTTNTRTGFIIGGVVDYSFTQQMGIVSGLRFIMKGAESVSGNQTFTTKLNFIEIPALFKVKFPLTEIKPYLIAGPTLGLRVSASVESSTGTGGGTNDVSSFYETIDFGLFFGGGLDFTIAPTTDLFFQTGYSLGLSNISKVTNQTAKTTGIQIIAGVKFRM